MSTTTLSPKAGVSTSLLASDTTEANQVESAPFGHALIAAATQNSRIVGLTADLGKYTDIHLFAQRFPDRFFQVGMAEQNLVGIAGGLARSGFVPFATTYCVFATRRAYDFIAIGAALSQANVKIIAGLPGLTTGYGATHQGIDDLALMRAIPNLTIVDPCDATEVTQAVPVIAKHEGPVYMRLLRGMVPVSLDPKTYRFEIGRAKLLEAGNDVAIISTGLMTARALEACTSLKAKGIHASILHLSTIKPFDVRAVLELVSRVPRVITAENHIISGGLGSAVADAVVDAGLAIQLKRIGIPNCFCDCGSIPHLVHRYGMDAESMEQAAEELCKN